MTSVELKIKAKHLATEPAIIKMEERKIKAQAAWCRLHQKSDAALMSKLHDLQSHRVNDVRLESRATHLARAYLSGKPYNEVEAKRKPEKEYHFRLKTIKRILSMVNKYRKRGTDQVTIEQIADWVNV